MSEFETITMYKSSLETALRITILHSAWWGADNPEKNAAKFAEDKAKERTDWIANSLTFDAITKKLKEKTNEIL